jgi:hypothetical protein
LNEGRENLKNQKQSPKRKLTQAAMLSVLLLILPLSACIKIVVPAPPVTATSLVLVITQIVTEIIPPTPLPATLTPVPTSTPEPATPTPTWDPLNAPVYYPLADCVASRLHLGDIAMVSLSGGANGIRFGSDLYQDTVIAYAQPGSQLEIVNGPYCSRGWIIWFVRMADGTVGYTPEGNGDEYWLLPVKP